MIENKEQRTGNREQGTREQGKSPILNSQFSIPDPQPLTPNAQHPTPAFHPLVWLVWLAAGVAAVSSNPLLNALVLAQALLVAITCHTDSPVGRAWRLFVGLGALLLVVRTLLSAVPIGGWSYGETVLLTLPTLRLPIWLGGLDVGGAATLEMLVGGFAGGIRLWALILLFGAFNAAADHYGLLRRTPRSLFHAGLVITIALTFVPQVIVQLATLRDAQRVRGRRFRGWRDGLPLIVPLLSGGLERSIQLAEAMDSRGYGRTTQRGGSGWTQIGLIVGLTALAIGLYAAFGGDGRGWIAIAIAVLWIAVLLRRSGSGPTRTRYLRDRWRGRDTAVVIASVLLMAGMWWLRLVDRGGLLYTPLPRVRLPEFDPLAGALLLLLSVPAMIALAKDEQTHDRQANLRSSPLADRIERNTA